jgi:hypothetical protein
MSFATRSPLDTAAQRASRPANEKASKARLLSIGEPPQRDPPAGRLARIGEQDLLDGVGDAGLGVSEIGIVEHHDGRAAVGFSVITEVRLS